MTALPLPEPLPDPAPAPAPPLRAVPVDPDDPWDAPWTPPAGFYPAPMAEDDPANFHPSSPVDPDARRPRLRCWACPGRHFTTEEVRRCSGAWNREEYEARQDALMWAAEDAYIERTGHYPPAWAGDRWR